MAISNYNSVSDIQNLDYHSWDAYCRDGHLVIECREASQAVSVYGVDGLTWLSEEPLAAGEHTMELPRGLYIVVSGDFVRRVLIK